jgi:nucleotidyltransferase substrate binding protein (TIGR01987 family)
MIQYDALEKALGQLEKALRFASGAEGREPDLFEQFRNSVIQTFEYSFELSFKLLRRTLAEAEASPEAAEAWSYNDVIRLGHRRGWLADPEAWFAFRLLRNKTSHGYDEAFAAEAYRGAREFLPAGRALAETLKGRTGV